ncbi:MAG: hypothetical protein AB1646_21300 [Thermodesulfobacteriota bacterium]
MNFSLLGKDNKLILSLEADISGLLPPHIDPYGPIKLEVVPQVVDDPEQFAQIVVSLSQVYNFGG